MCDLKFFRILFDELALNVLLLNSSTLVKVYRGHYICDTTEKKTHTLIDYSFL